MNFGAHRRLRDFRNGKNEDYRSHKIVTPYFLPFFLAKVVSELGLH